MSKADREEEERETERERERVPVQVGATVGWPDTELSLTEQQLVVVVLAAQAEIGRPSKVVVHAGEIILLVFGRRRQLIENNVRLLACLFFTAAAAAAAAAASTASNATLRFFTLPHPLGHEICQRDAGAGVLAVELVGVRHWAGNGRPSSLAC